MSHILTAIAVCSSQDQLVGDNCTARKCRLCC